MQKEPIKIYRIENQETNHGMWYDKNGNYNPFIERLTDGKSASLPMDYDERYGDGGVRWYSGCSDIETMQHWFSDQDAKELSINGYKLYIFETAVAKEEELQTLFIREGIVRQTEIPLDVIWDFK